jgi:hypothetical protein
MHVEGSMSLTEYHFLERWHADAPPDAVWELVADPRTYPRWWPEFLDVTPLNDVTGVGARVAVHVKAALPYHMRFELESVRYERPYAAEVLVRGDLVGQMRWLLTPYAGGTYLVFEEEVRTGKQLLNVLAPLGKPFFAWNHSGMMRHGEAGLRGALQRDAAIEASRSGSAGFS